MSEWCGSSPDSSEFTNTDQEKDIVGSQQLRHNYATRSVRTEKQQRDV